MTHFERAGHTPDTLFRCRANYNSLRKGDLVKLKLDDGSSSPKFYSVDDPSKYEWVYFATELEAVTAEEVAKASVNPEEIQVSIRRVSNGLIVKVGDTEAVYKSATEFCDVLRPTVSALGKETSV